MGDRALPLLERAVEIASIAFGPEHPRVASCLADLGALLVNDLGLPVRARPVLERALHIYETTSGVQHPALVILLVNLANAMSRDERDAARKFLERAVEIASAPIQRPWWELSTDLRNLGRALIRFGMESIAQTMLKRALVLDQGISANHPAVASDLWLLAVVCLSRGERAAACPFLEQAYAILDGSLGSNHPDTVKVQRALQRLREDLPGNTGPL